MVGTIDLHNIFRHLTGDENFLSTVIETKNEVKKKKKRKSSSISNMIREYYVLPPNETQDYDSFPALMKNYLTPEYTRIGIKNDLERNNNTINVSFLYSLNILIRPDIQKAGIDEQIKSYLLLEEMIKHKIRCNFQIDKIKKNTKKVQQANNELIKLLLEGKISDELIQYIINIFEINLLVFDLTKMEVSFYWTKGEKYPFFNPFKNILCMTYINNYYEPVLHTSNELTEEQQIKIYSNILTNLSKIKCACKLRIGLHTLLYIESWDLDAYSFCKISEIYLKELKYMEDILEVDI